MNHSRSNDQGAFRYVDEREVSRITGLALSTLRNARSTGRGPCIPHLKIGRAVRYSLIDVIRYMEERKIEPRGD